MLEPLIGHQRALQTGRGPGDTDAATHAAVRDGGDRYVIQVADVERSQQDPARDCRERARVAAVFIALNLRAPAPPAVTPPPSQPPAPAPAPAPVSASTPAPAPAAPSVQVNLGAFASLAYAPRAQISGGGGLSIWMRYKLLGVGLESGAMSATRLEITPSTGGGHVDLLRLPSALTVAALWRISRISLGPVLGLAVDALRAEGRALDRTKSHWRANLGLVAGLRSETHLTESWSLLAQLTGAYYPRSYVLRVEPDQRIAHTPHFWLAAQVGLLCRLR
ncbi:MAG TPA: hypothetical protein VFZ61_10050 [Polyangiales bacterium]